MKKRKERRNPIAELDFMQEFELAVCRSKEPWERNGKKNFANAVQKRAAYFAHRDYLLNEGFGSRPGRRPGGWWLYEADQPKPEGSEEWEKLLKMDVMDNAEKGAVLSEWIETLELNENSLSLYYDTFKGCGTMHHVKDTWPDQKAKYEHQAKVLAEYIPGGQAAIQEWEVMLVKVEKNHQKSIQWRKEWDELCGRNNP